jgi:hypothetical protein
MRVVRWLRLEGRERSQHSQQSSCHHPKMFGYESKHFDKWPFTGAVIVAGAIWRISDVLFMCSKLAIQSQSVCFLRTCPTFGPHFHGWLQPRLKAAASSLEKKQTICVRI